MSRTPGAYQCTRAGRQSGAELVKAVELDEAHPVNEEEERQLENRLAAVEREIAQITFDRLRLPEAPQVSCRSYAGCGSRLRVA